MRANHPIRRTTAVILFASAMMILAAGCQRRGGSETAAAGGARSVPVAEAAAGEGMCPEHGVLEAVCTRCNPRLIPVFQAKGDWCAEHGFPESFCPSCHPERAGQPQGDVTTDPGPPDGLRVTLQSPGIAEEIGIETATVLPAKDAGTIIATATIVADNSMSAVVNVRTPGVIRSFKVELGARVAANAPLALIESASVGEARARLRAARPRAELAESSYLREKELHERGITSLKELQAAEQNLEDARAEAASASSALDMIGSESGEAGMYELRAPIAGVVTQRNFTVGTLVDESDALFEIIDTSLLWADIDIPESQAGLVSPGQRVVLEAAGLPGEEFEGLIRYVAPVVDAHTRTIRARVGLDNRRGLLRANMYAQARIYAGAGAASVVVPRSSLQEANGVQMVFVSTAPGDYVTRRVRTLPSDGEMVAVTEGLREGETVVTTGSFLLKTETLKESIGAGCCEVEPGK